MSNFLKIFNKTEHLASAKIKLSTYVNAKLKQLAIIRAYSITIDSNGKVDSDSWNTYVKNIFIVEIFPLMTPQEKKAIYKAGLSKIGNEFVETPVRNECTRMHETGEHDMTVQVLDSSHTDIQAPKKTRTTGSGLITRGLIIRDEPIEKILNGLKTWEMRSTNTKIREKIALIKKGTKAIYGVAEIVESRGPLTRSEMNESISLHRITADRMDDPEVSKYKHAWVLEGVQRLKRPIPYQHTGGVTFVSLDDTATQQLMDSLARD